MTETSPVSASGAPSTPAPSTPASSEPDPAAPAAVRVRFFAAAAEAAGVEELRLLVPTKGIAVGNLLADLPRLVREQQSTAPAGEDQDDAGAASPSLERVCARSSFLANGIRAQPETVRLDPGDQLDVLAPFAGG